MKVRRAGARAIRITSRADYGLFGLTREGVNGASLMADGCAGAHLGKDVPVYPAMLRLIPEAQIMQILATTGDACISCLLGQGAVVPATTIRKSVGVGGANQREDVLAIQKLLNSIEPQNGGPTDLLAEDGWVGPNTNGAIKRFQLHHKLGSDTRVDPDGPMLKKMNSQLKKPRYQQAAAARLARAARAMPDLIGMARQAELACDQAMMAIRAGSKATSLAYRRADLYFKFGQMADNLISEKLRFLRTTYVRVKNVLASPPSPVTGGNPFGVSVFTDDPRGLEHMAYVPTERTVDPKRRQHPDVHPGRVYLCIGIDSTVEDHFAHILFHEMVHFIDEETQARYIFDHGYRDDAMRLPHALRMHNSDNYALLASHIHFGRARLVASQPKLGPHVPQDL